MTITASLCRFRVSVNRCLLRATLLSKPLYSDASGLNIQRVCDAVGSSIFVASLWVGGNAESALREHLMRLNAVKVHIDLFVESGRTPMGKVSSEALRIWRSVSERVGKYADACVDGYAFLERILFLSNPLKLKDALALCDGCRDTEYDVCRLYSDELDSATGLVLQQIELVREANLGLVA